MMIEVWIFGTYCLGTVVGLYFGFEMANKKVVARTIDNLIKNGYLRSRRLPNGDEEILKHGEE